MSHTNATANYALPQFIATDQPGWMSDVNSAMQTIDTNLKSVSDGVVTNAGNIATINTTLSNNLPTQGAAGQVLTKTASGAEYKDIPVDLSLDLTSNTAVANSAVTLKTNSLDTQINSLQTALGALGDPSRGATSGSGVSGDVYYAQIGKLVVCAFWINCANNVSASSAIATGLPHCRVNNMLIQANDNNHAAVIKLYLTTEGRITTPNAIQSSASLRGSFCYISE